MNEPNIFGDVGANINVNGGGENLAEVLRQRWALGHLAAGRSIDFSSVVGLPVRGHAAAVREIAERFGLGYYINTRLFATAWGNDWFVECHAGGSYIWHTSGSNALAMLDAWHAEKLRVDKQVVWFRMGQHGINGQPMSLSGADPMPEFYPWLDQPIELLWRDFMASTANVMLLIGPPGTGKTSFLRGGLRASNAAAWVTYDRAVQQSEELYTKFAEPERGESAADDDDDDDDEYGLSGIRFSRRPGARPTSRDGRVLVLEDADTMLESRRDGNELMRRLLGIADGLVSLPKRKVVFTTNLPSLSSVDDALLRPGRCFAVLNFRKLTAEEAAAAARAIGEEREFEAGRTYTLAEALKTRMGGEGPVRRFGF